MKGLRDITPEKAKQAEMFVRGKELSERECKKILKTARRAWKMKLISEEVYIEISRIVEEQRKKS